MKHFPVYWLTCVLMIVASAASATTIVMPTDDQLIGKSPVVVRGTVLESTVVEREGGLWTETRIDVDQTLKGNAEGVITVREIGGELNGRITKIFGTPEFVAGERVLLFLEPLDRGFYRTIDLYAGKFREARTRDSQMLWMREESADVVLLDASFRPIEAETIGRDAVRFEAFIADRAAGRDSAAGYGVANPVLDETTGPRALRATANFSLISEPTVYRWFVFDNGGSASWYSSGAQTGYTGGGVTEVKSGMAPWNNYASARIKYSYSGVMTGAPRGNKASNGVNEVVFNDPNDEISGSFVAGRGGVVGVGGFNGVSGAQNWTAPFQADATHTATTYRAYNITEGNMVIQDGVTAANGISSATLAEIIAHEFGHTLGFGHSGDSTALMYSSVTGGGASLRSDDQSAARWLYPSGASAPPIIIAPVAPTSLAANSTGAAVTLQWTDNATNEAGYHVYMATGNGSFARENSVGADARTATVSGLSAGSYRFYVTAHNAGGESAASNTATVTIAALVNASFTLTPTTGTAGTTVFTFTDTSTGPVATRVWQFGDGATSSSATPTHVYGSAGTYNVSLTVSGNGYQTQATRIVVVTDPQPAVTAAFSWSPVYPTVQTTITFTDQSTGSPSGWLWTFGDGTTSSQQNPMKRYSSAGSYTVSLTVYRGSATASFSRTITIADVTPVVPPVSASFDFAPSSPIAGEPVTFTDRSTGNPFQWTWNFGDGSTASGISASHIYSNGGTYTVSLTASNGASSATTTRTVTVRAAVVPFRSLVSVTAQTNGVGGSVWRTEMSLFNAGSEAATGQYVFIPGSGAAILQRSFYLAPRQSLTYGNALQEIFGVTSGAGAIAIEATAAGSAPDLRVTSRTYTTGTIGTYGQAVPDVVTTIGQTLYVPGIVSTSDFRTNVGLVNRSAGDVSVALTLLDQDGQMLSATTIVVPANNFQQASLPSFFPMMTSRSDEGLALRVVASVPDAVSAYASIVDNRTQDPVYVQGVPIPSESRAVVPAVGRSEGANNTFWRSDVTLLNPTPAWMTVSLRYLPSGGDNRNAIGRSMQLAPHQSVTVRDVVGSFSVPAGSGALEVVSNSGTAPVVTSRTYTPASTGGTYGQSIDPVSTWARDIYVPGLRSDLSFRSNVGFVNGGDTTIGVVVSALASNGTTVGTGFVTLPPRGQAQTSVAALFPGVDVASLGNFTLQAHTDGEATLFAYGSIVDNNSGDPVFYAGR